MLLKQVLSISISVDYRSVAKYGVVSLSCSFVVIIIHLLLLEEDYGVLNIGVNSSVSWKLWFRRIDLVLFSSVR